MLLEMVEIVCEGLGIDLRDILGPEYGSNALILFIQLGHSVTSHPRGGPHASMIPLAHEEDKRWGMATSHSRGGGTPALRGSPASRGRGPGPGRDRAVVPRWTPCQAVLRPASGGGRGARRPRAARRAKGGGHTRAV